MNFSNVKTNKALMLEEKALSMTKQLMFVEKLENEWILYGKTGNHSINNIQQGWFVGFLKKEKEAIVFAYLIIDSKPETDYASLRAKAALKNRIPEIIEKYILTM